VRTKGEMGIQPQASGAKLGHQFWRRVGETRWDFALIVDYFFDFLISNNNGLHPSGTCECPWTEEQNGTESE